MIKECNINVPNYFELDELKVIDTIPSSDDKGILVAAENFNDCNMHFPTVRLYLVELIKGIFEVTKELDAFSFRSMDDAKEFSEKLPKMNAIDLVLFMNKKRSNR